MTGGTPLVSDFSLLHALVWWASLSLLTLMGWALTRRIFVDWHDAGWGLARTLSVLLAGYALWLLGHGVALSPTGVRLGLAACALLTFVWMRSRHRPWIDTSSLRQIVRAEARFLVPFALYLGMRGFNHDIIGLEKFMDFAYMNAALQAPTVPVPDPWFAGHAINYYYFGHYLAAFLCKLSGVPAAYGYNLMLATIFASLFQLAYAFVAEMTRRLSTRISSSAALLAGIWLCVGGNLHGFLYGFVKPWLVSFGWVAPPRQAFLISDPTRFVGYDPQTADRLIHEFPAYALYVGDLHGHLSNLPGVLLLLSLVLCWLRAQSRLTHAFASLLPLALSAWLVGIFAMTNSWDALMYGSLLGGLLILAFVQALPTGLVATRRAVFQGLFAAGVTALTATPFLLNFHPFSAGFFATHTHTPVWQWLILYGLQTLLACLACGLAHKHRLEFLHHPEKTLLFALTAFGLACALVPEFIYLKDIYAPEYYRSNTAFKFGFQAFTVLTLAACIGLALFLSTQRARSARARVLLILLAELIAVPPLYYAWFVAQGGFGVWQERSWTLDGQRYLTQSHPEDKAIIDWLGQNAHAGQVLAEAVGDSYTFGARIASNTGLANIIGWPVHEQLWRGSAPEVWTRRDDVARLYQATRSEDAKAVLARYRVHWLVLGRFEKERHPTLNTALLQSLGRVAFQVGESCVIEIGG
jgi:uncharacterized membrane protein